MTPEQLREIEQRWAKATPGPWEYHYCDAGDFDQPTWDGNMEVWPKGADKTRRADVLNIPIADVGYHGSGEYDAQAIASAPTDIVALLAEVRRLNRMVDRACIQRINDSFCVVEDMGAEQPFADCNTDRESDCEGCWRKYLESEVAGK